MRVKDFAEKYNLPYRVVYDSTWLVKKDSDLDEETALKEAVTEHLNGIIARNMNALEKAKSMLKMIEP